MGNKIISYQFPRMGGFNMKEERMMMTTLIYVVIAVISFSLNDLTQ